MTGATDEWTLDRFNRELSEAGMTRFMQIYASAWFPETKRLTLVMPFREELQGGAGPGHLHGGATGALIDTAATYCLLGAGLVAAPTANYRIDLLRPITDAAHVEASAAVRRIGRTLALVDVEVAAGSKLAALGRLSFVVA